MTVTNIYDLAATLVDADGPTTASTISAEPPKWIDADDYLANDELEAVAREHSVVAIVVNPEAGDRSVRVGFEDASNVPGLRAALAGVPSFFGDTVEVSTTVEGTTDKIVCPGSDSDDEDDSDDEIDKIELERHSGGGSL